MFDGTVQFVNLDFSNEKYLASKFAMGKKTARIVLNGIRKTTEQFIGEGLNYIDYDIGYSCGESEVFTIDNFDLPEILDRVIGNSVILDPFSGDLDDVNILAIIDCDTRCIAFQKIDRSQRLEKSKKTIILKDYELTISDSPQMILRDYLNCVYFNRTLYFKNANSAKRALPDFDFRLLNEEKAAEFMKNEIFQFEDKDSFDSMKHPAQFYRDLSIIKENKILQDKNKIKEISEKTGIEILNKEGKIVVPADKEDINLIFGALSDRVHASNIQDDAVSISNSSRTKSLKKNDGN